MAVGMVTGPPLWSWPEAFDLSFPSLLMDRGTLWKWQPTRITTLHGQRFEEPVKFPDDRTATLLCFEPGRRRALPLAFRFEKDGKPHNPFESRENSLPMGSRSPFGPQPTPFLFFTPKHLIVATWAAPGYWLIPRTDLESRSTRLRQIVKSNEPVEGAK